MIINGNEVKKALIIKPYWGNLILNKEKFLELRSSNVNIRGTVALIFSGTNKIWGTVDIIGSSELSDEDFIRFRKYHRYTEGRDKISYKKLWGWVLDNAKRLEEPISFKPKGGCVIWANL